MILKSDCRHFPGDRPCFWNKQHGQTCDGCTHYAPQGKRILVIKLAALGDVLRTTAILPAIHAANPGCSVVWLTQSNAAELLRGNPLIQELWTVEGESTTRLPAEEFDLVFCPDADKRAAALAAVARGRRRLGMVLNPRGFVEPANAAAAVWLEMGAFDQLKKANTRSYQQHLFGMLEMEFRAEEIQLHLRPAELDHARLRLFDLGLQPNQLVIGLNLGGGGRWKKKRWKPHHFEAFARLAAQRTGARILLIGGEAESGLMDELADTLGRLVLIAGSRCGLRETAALIAQCRVLVTGDTLGLHMASALKVPTVVLLGPTSAVELELYGRGAHVVAPIPCVCCYLTDCEVDPDCMQRIDPAVVLGEVQRFF